MTLFPKSDNYYMGDNIPGKPRNVVFFFGGFPLYREQFAHAGADLNGFSIT
jgi:cyclohexanone monooxygenase